MLINYKTQPSGSIRIELQDLLGRPYPGFALQQCLPIRGDQIGGPVSWRDHGSSVAELAGRPVRIKFQLTDADLYSYRFESPP